jgi:hypothetical protein
MIGLGQYCIQLYQSSHERTKHLVLSLSQSLIGVRRQVNLVTSCSYNIELSDLYFHIFL